MAHERALRSHAIPQSHYAYASALAQLGRNDEALQHYSRAVEMQPDFAEAHNNRANLLLAAGQREAAITGYHAALKIKPDYLEAHVLAVEWPDRWAEAPDDAIRVRITPTDGDGRAIQIEFSGLADGVNERMK